MNFHPICVAENLCAHGCSSFGKSPLRALELCGMIVFPGQGMTEMKVEISLHKISPFRLPYMRAVHFNSRKRLVQWYVLQTLQILVFSYINAA